MQFIKRIISLLTALLFAFFNTAGFTSLTVFAEASDGTSETNEIDGSGEDFESLYGSADYVPDDGEYQRWSGATAFKDGVDYYIDKPVKLSKEKHIKLPQNSKLVIRNNGSLTVYSDSKLDIKGQLIIEPSAKLAVSGELAALQGSEIMNYGTFCATKSSSAHISSTFLTGNKGISAFSGNVKIYGQGAAANCGRLTFAQKSETTVSGKMVCAKNGMIFQKGALTVTMNGEIRSEGALYLYNNAVVSGDVTLEPGSALHRLDGGKITLTKCGKLIDRRGERSANSAQITDKPSEYDAEPEKVAWKGIDVSRYQGAINWERVKASGVDFVILRSSIGDGSDYISGEDIRFAKNAVDAKEAGLMVGAYHYLWAETVADARKEARFFIKTISPHKLDFPAVLDFEEPSQQENLTTAERTAIAKAFMEEVEKAGYYPMLYTNKNWAVNYLDMDELAEYDLWVAEWQSSPTYGGDYGIWQYTAAGKVSGIDEEIDVDLDICTKNYRKLILDGGYNHLK